MDHYGASLSGWLNCNYSGRRITLSFSYVTEIGEGRWEGQGAARRQRVCLSMYSVTENIYSLLISTQSVAFSCTDFYTTLYFTNQRNYKTLAMQAHALTRTRYFYSLNIIISHLIVTRKDWVISPYVLSLRGLPLPPMCICNGHPGSELCCVHCRCVPYGLFVNLFMVYLTRLSTDSVE
jgi:hypothetical protein